MQRLSIEVSARNSLDEVSAAINASCPREWTVPREIEIHHDSLISNGTIFVFIL